LGFLDLAALVSSCSLVGRKNNGDFLLARDRLESVSDCPGPRILPEVDLGYLSGIPKASLLAPWTIEDIFEAMPSGAPGLDGLSFDKLSSISYDALIALTLLLNAADKGRFPAFWRFARVTLIPKGDGAAADDRRPLTVMPISYRLWAKRLAHHLVRWLSTWKPDGLSGAVIGVGCADVLWKVTEALNDALVGITDTRYVLSLDQEKCFDRLHLPMLQRVCHHLGLDSCCNVLTLYAGINRLLFVDSQPTTVWLAGNNTTGIPQGCPIACFFCNLTSILWHRMCQNVAPHTVCYSVLDDRLAIAKSWADLDVIYRNTLALDVTLGPALNVRK
jgi:hypothetical protein